MRAPAPSQTARSPAAPEFLPLSAARAPGAAPDPRQVVLVPGGSVPLYTLDLPDRLRGQAREQVARRQLADRLGQAPGMRPFAPASAPGGRPGTAAWTQVLAADPAWLDGLKTLPGRAVLPDYLSLPAAREVWTLAAGEEGSILARLGPGDGFSAPPALAALLLERALAQGPAPKALLLLEDPLPAVRGLAREHGIALAATPGEVAALGLPRPLVLGHGELDCDLRRNPMAARAQLARRVLPWRWPLLAAGLAAALWTGAQTAAVQRLEKRTAALNEATMAQVQAEFTNGAPVLDPRLQVSRALAGLRAAASGPEGARNPLELAGRVADVVTGQTAADSTPERLSYRRGEGLELVIGLRDFAAADQLAGALHSAGLAAELADSRTGPGTAAEAGGPAAAVRAEFRISTAEDRP